MGLSDPLKTDILKQLRQGWRSLIVFKSNLSTALTPFDGFRVRGDRKPSPCKPDTLFNMSVQAASAVSANFAEFLLDSAEDGNEILAVLDDIAEVTESAL